MTRATQRSDAAIAAWLKHDYPKIARRARQERALIYWGDETGISNQDQIGRGYAPKGQTPVVHKTAKKVSTSMISAVNNRGLMRFMGFAGALNAALFIMFLRRLIGSGSGKLFLIVDNLRVHHSAKVTRWVDAHRDRMQQARIIHDVARERGARPVKVLVADDHSVFRQGLGLVLAGLADGIAVLEASDFGEALALAQALRLVLVGGIYVPRDLTPRQHDVLALIADGLSNKEIGYRLGTSEGTVKAHVTAIMRSLGARNRVQMLLAAERRGIKLRPPG